MVLSYYLTKYPYKAIWFLLNRAGLTDEVVFYCGTEMDVLLFAPVQKYLKPLPVVAKDKKVQRALQQQGTKAKRLPVFPRAVIMCRQAAYRFPEEKIIKFGMRHGPYYFKPFANPRGYNMINRFFMTSRSEVEAARKVGIKTGVPIGYPKLDPAFDGSYDAAFLQKLRIRARIDTARPTLLLTATWDDSGLSAVAQWAGRLSELADQYNLLVTVHPWTSEKYRQQIKQTAGVYYIADYDVVPWIMLADLCIGDYSSILAECCALDKPVMTFVLPDARRTVPEVKALIEAFSERIHSFDELLERLPEVLGAPNRLQDERRQAARVMFDALDGKAGQRAAEEITRYFPELRL